MTKQAEKYKDSAHNYAKTSEKHLQLSRLLNTHKTIIFEITTIFIIQ